MAAFVVAASASITMRARNSGMADVDSSGPVSPQRRVSRRSRPKGRRSRRGRRDLSRDGSGTVGAMISPTENASGDLSVLSGDKWPALVLNADWQPLSYVPLSLWPWQEVMKAVFLGRVNVVATYDMVVRSPSAKFPLPSVISLKQYQPPARRPAAFTRFNVFLRDMFECQYCGRKCQTQDLTFDHVVPRCRGGRTNWENVASACVACNHAKGRHLLRDLGPRFQLRRIPEAPTQFELQRNARMFPPRHLHESWRDYMYWTTPLDEEQNQNHAADMEDSRALENNRWP